MKTNIQSKMLGLIALVVTLSGFAPMGTHSFLIQLDDKTVTEQYVINTMTIPKVIIDPAEDQKHLTVKYNECGKTVSGRVISLKDVNNKLIKQWKFDGTTSGYKDPMTLSVKEITSLKQSSWNTLNLFYSSAEFAAGQHIATLVIGPGSNTASK